MAPSMWILALLLLVVVVSAVSIRVFLARPLSALDVELARVDELTRA